MRAPVIPLTDVQAADPSLTGAKAARLSELARAGLPVPPGFVITVAAFERASAGGMGGRLRLPEAERALVARAAADLLGPFAVRSSGVAEDLEGHSFAGQYETLLNVAAGDLVGAIEACWASALSVRATSYREARGLVGAQPMAVLVQQMVAAEAAGVAFTANPRTGNRREIVINAVLGLGERLVSGEATAEEWVVSDAKVTRAGGPERALTSEGAADVATLARRVGVHYDGPQDIEWALCEGTLYLLQARPITAVPDTVSWDTPAAGLWLRTFRLGEWLSAPVTPLFETWLLERMEARLFLEMERIVTQGMPGPYHVTVNGWYFTTGNFTPRGVLHALYLALRFLLPAALLKPKVFSVLTTARAHIGMAHFERLWRAGPKLDYERAVNQAEGQAKSCDVHALPALIDGLADAAGQEAFYFFMSGGSAWKAEIALASFYRKHIASSADDTYQALLQGLTQNMRAGGHAVLSLDWHEPTLVELGLAGTAPNSDARRAEAVERRQAAELNARDRLGSGSRLLRRFDVLLRRAQAFGRLREEQAAHLTLAWPVLRTATRRMGQALADDGVLNASDDVYFLLRGELEEALTGAATGERPRPPDLAASATRRKAELEAQRRLTPPDHVGRMSAIQRAIFHGSARVLAGGARPTPRTGQVTGHPASPGRVTGRARVILSAPDFARLAEGDILIAPATNPGWTPLFARAAAVVTDTGSLMAHASLLAREYGVPSVVGCGNATTSIRDGQAVTVDGTTGTVELLD